MGVICFGRQPFVFWGQLTLEGGFSRALGEDKEWADPVVCGVHSLSFPESLSRRHIPFRTIVSGRPFLSGKTFPEALCLLDGRFRETFLFRKAFSGGTFLSGQSFPGEVSFPERFSRELFPSWNAFPRSPLLSGGLSGGILPSPTAVSGNASFADACFWGRFLGGRPFLGVHSFPAGLFRGYGSEHLSGEGEERGKSSARRVASRDSSAAGVGGGGHGETVVSRP